MAPTTSTGNRRVISTPGVGELAAQPLERLVDPGAVADPGFDDRGLLHLGFLLGLGGAEDRLHFGERHAQHAVAVAEHEVARLDHHAADGDRNVDLAGAVLVRTAMGDAGGEHGKIAGADRGGIPDRAVDDAAGDAAFPRMRHHQLTDDGAGEIAAGVDDDHVARLGEIERLVHHQGALVEPSNEISMIAYHHALISNVLDNAHPQKPKKEGPPTGTPKGWKEVVFRRPSSP